VTDATPALRLALDQNFPTPLIRAIAAYLPPDLELRSLNEIDPRLSRLEDRSLFLTLHHLGWHGLVTNNYRMLDEPWELAAIIRTQAVVVAVKGLGHDPLRAAGALLLDLPGLTSRILPHRSNVFLLSYRGRLPSDARDYLKSIAERRRRAESDLWQEVVVTADEFNQARLEPT
jgi:hypothetical protein